MIRITSRENEGIKLLTKFLGSAKERKLSGLFVLEGMRLIEDAIGSKVDIKAIYLSESRAEKSHSIIKQAEENGWELFLISDELMGRISDTKSPQGIMALCNGQLVGETLPDDMSKGALMLCSLQDPGNLGTIIRTADAFGLSAVILTDEYPSVTSPKVLRASMGSIFRIPVITFGTTEQAADALAKKGITLVGAALSEDSVSIHEVNLKNTCIAIGNEGAGLNENQMECCKSKVILPIKPTCESLNAAMAAGIFAWELKKAVNFGE